MKNADLMTPEELRRLAEEKEQEENKVVKRATLKHDLYDYPLGRNGLKYERTLLDTVLTEKERNKLIKDFTESLKKVLVKGTKFVAFMLDGKLHWFDDVNYGVEFRDDKWAEEHLENFE